MTFEGESVKAGTAMDYPKRNPYPLRSRTGSRKRQGEEPAMTSREIRARPYSLRSRADSRRLGFSSPVERSFVFSQYARRISQRTPSV
ncbi:hypothetical protein TNCT_504321 [Trichonephila clavata]|uniref:Uncharacterized protein n=1 Tax=Trichonephila clavata TaxID=2740835 RepID=A0A8X6F5V3_TRICU|nr:hypothetical protein TNCT_504321 [Trichonephila clavata]